MSAVVYRVFDDNDRLLYVGCTVNLESRLAGHESISPWWPFHSRIEATEYPTRKEAAEAEVVAIATEHPRWNVKHRAADHPDGPISYSRFAAPWLRQEIALWREWIHIKWCATRPCPPPQSELDARRERLTQRLMEHHAAVRDSLPTAS